MSFKIVVYTMKFYYLYFNYKFPLNIFKQKIAKHGDRIIKLLENKILIKILFKNCGVVSE